MRGEIGDKVYSTRSAVSLVLMCGALRDRPRIAG